MRICIPYNSSKPKTSHHLLPLIPCSSHPQPKLLAQTWTMPVIFSWTPSWITETGEIRKGSWFSVLEMELTLVCGQWIKLNRGSLPKMRSASRTMEKSHAWLEGVSFWVDVKVIILLGRCEGKESFSLTTGNDYQ